ncbi:uncharacterized protein [Macrobrachium rosenbergii]|uniref:uncharacterized protein n=1 Tax=Macrobrachium rosenbergii TaxID=79674 RepID=UPI0034D69EBB
MRLATLATVTLVLIIAPTKGTLDLLIKKKIVESAKSDLLKTSSFTPVSNFKDYYVLGGLLGQSGYLPPTQSSGGSSHGSVPGGSASISLGGTGSIGGTVSIGSVSTSGGIASGGNNFGFSSTGQGSGNVASGGNNFGFTSTSQGSGNVGIASTGNNFGFTSTSHGSGDAGIVSGGNNFGFTSTSHGSGDAGIVSGGNNFGFTSTGQGSGLGVTGSNVASQGGIIDVSTGSQVGLSIPNGGTGDAGITAIVGSTGSSVSVSDDSSSSGGFGAIGSGGVVISGGGGSVGGGLVSLIDGGVTGVGGGLSVCPDVTVPVVEEAVMTQYVTEYVTVPQQIENYVVSTVPFVKPLYVTQTVPITVTEINETGYCTTTHLFYQTESLPSARIVPLTQSLTETEVFERTRTITNTLTQTSVVTQVQTQIRTVFTTVVGHTRTITRLSTTTEYVTNTVTSQYNIRSTTVAGVGVPVWITSNTEVWLPVTRTRTLNKTSYQTVWKSCGGYY